MSNGQLAYFVRRAALAAIGFLAASLVATKLIYTVLGEPPIGAIESPILIAKETIVRESPQVNYLFVGSSATWRQINPAVFDNQLPSQLGAYSYNLGNDGLYPMRSLVYLEHLLDTMHERINVVFFELYALDELSRNFSSPEIMRITNLREFIAVVRTIATADFPRREKLALFGQYLRSFAYKSLGFGLASYQLFERPLPATHAERIERGLRGFYAKDVELRETTFADNREKLAEVGSILQQRPELLDERRRIHEVKYSRNWRVTANPYTDKLLELLNQAEQRGVRLIFVIPPLLSQAGISFAYPTFLQLPESSRLDMSDPARYPEVYEPQNVFDVEHVNSRGAEYLSRYLADEYSRLISVSDSVALPVN